MGNARLKKYSFALVPPAFDRDTGVDIYDCFGGSAPYVVKHDRIHDEWSCSCPDFDFRRRRAHEDCVHIAELKRSLKPEPQASG